MIKEDWMIADLHIHSRFSRACSKNITLENLVKWAKIKGLNLLGTGDFTHPTWLGEIKQALVEKNGFYYYGDFPFVLTGEISLIYTQKKGRRIHLVLLVPCIDVAEKINSYLDTKGRRDYDGRPLFNISGDEFVRELKKISEGIEIIPAHAWTPWFGIFGSSSGFDSLKECFGEEVYYIHAIETGMSSDPAMNWRIKELGNRTVVSFSDAHSFWPFRLGREATIFRRTDSYKELIRQIRENDIIGTIETDPAYGKYHFDGHRNCNFSCDPKKTVALRELCPVCNKPLVIGVENRIEQLAFYPREFKPKDAKPFFRLLPLHELIALVANANMQSDKAWTLYNSLIGHFQNEFAILLDVSREELIRKGVSEKLVLLIMKNRIGKIKVKPGFDGEYGVAQLDEQKTLF